MMNLQQYQQLVKLAAYAIAYVGTDAHQGEVAKVMGHIDKYFLLV